MRKAVQRVSFSLALTITGGAAGHEPNRKGDGNRYRTRNCPTKGCQAR